ncbi:unnamed protein product, partial [Closterium sp. NIES-64]
KDLTSLYSGFADPAAEIKSHHAFIRDTINVAAKTIHSLGFPAARVKVEEGDPRKVIPKVAEAEKADLLVLGSQGKRTLHYMLAGDVASHCAKKCSCAVITYKSINGGSVAFSKRAVQEQKRLGISLSQFTREADDAESEVLYGRFQSSIDFDGQRHTLGTWDDPMEAAKGYAAAAYMIVHLGVRAVSAILTEEEQACLKRMSHDDFITILKFPGAWKQWQRWEELMPRWRAHYENLARKHGEMDTVRIGRKKRKGKEQAIATVGKFTAAAAMNGLQTPMFALDPAMHVEQGMGGEAVGVGGGGVVGGVGGMVGIGGVGGGEVAGVGGMGGVGEPGVLENGYAGGEGEEETGSSIEGGQASRKRARGREVLGCNKQAVTTLGVAKDEVLGYNQQAVTTLGVAKDVGDNMGLLAGLLADMVPPWLVIAVGTLLVRLASPVLRACLLICVAPSTGHQPLFPHRTAPTCAHPDASAPRCLVCPSLPMRPSVLCDPPLPRVPPSPLAWQGFVGYGGLWLVLSQRIAAPPFWQVWCLLCCATNGSIYFITAGLVSSQLNFPHSGGVVAGIVVGFIGLSGAIFAQVLLGGQGDGRYGLGGRSCGGREGGRCGGSQGGKAGEIYSALLAPNPPAFLLLACIGPAAVGILSLFIPEWARGAFKLIVYPRPYAPLSPGMPPCPLVCPPVPWYAPLSPGMPPCPLVCPPVPWYAPLSLGMPPCPLVCPPVPWYAPLSPGMPPCPLVCPPVPWYAPLSPGMPPCPLVCPPVPWYAPLSPGMPPCPLVCPPVPWYAPLSPGMPPCPLVCPPVPWYAPLSPGMPPCPLVCPPVPWYAPLSPGMPPLSPGMPPCPLVCPPCPLVCPPVPWYAPLSPGMPPCPLGSSDLSQPLLQSSPATSAATGTPGGTSPRASVLPPIREGETLHAASALPPSSPPPTHPPAFSLSPHQSAFSPLSHSRTSPKPTYPERTSPYNSPPPPSSGRTCSSAQNISSSPAGGTGGRGLRGAGAISFVSPNRSGDAPKLGLSSSITAAAHASSFGTHSSVGSATLMHLLLGTSADSRTNRSEGAASVGGGEGEGGEDDWSYYFGEEETSVHGKNLSRVTGITSPKGGYSRGGDDGEEDECREEEEEEDGEEGEEEEEEGDGAGDEATEQAHPGGTTAARGEVYLGEDHSFGQALSTVEFWLLYGGLVCGFGAGLTAITNLAQIGEAQGYGNAQVLTSLVSIWQFLGRLASGSLSEHFVRAHGMPRPMALAAIQLLMAVGHLAFALAPPGGVYLGSLLIGFTYGGLCSVMPVIAAELFGRRCLGLLYNSLLAAAPLGSYLFSGVLAGYLYEIEARKDRGVTAGLEGAASLLAPRQEWALKPVVRVGHVAGASADFTGVRKMLGLMLPSATPTAAVATTAATAGAEHMGQGWLGTSWFGQGMGGWFSDAVGSAAGGGGGEGPKACHGAHCFRLIFLILTAVCVLGAAVNLLVASRTARVYGLMRHTEAAGADETDEAVGKDDEK